MPLMMIVFWGGLAWLVVMLLRQGDGRLGRRDPVPSQPPPASPEDIVHERFARGEIDAEEYRHRLETLRSGRQPGHS
jgi:putative membrane protein